MHTDMESELVQFSHCPGLVSYSSYFEGVEFVFFYDLSLGAA